jgi:hypothetical protein
VPTSDRYAASDSAFSYEGNGSEPPFADGPPERQVSGTEFGQPYDSNGSTTVEAHQAPTVGFLPASCRTIWPTDCGLSAMS